MTEETSQIKLNWKNIAIETTIASIVYTSIWFPKWNSLDNYKTLSKKNNIELYESIKTSKFKLEDLTLDNQTDLVFENGKTFYLDPEGMFNLNSFQNIKGFNEKINEKISIFEEKNSSLYKKLDKIKEYSVKNKNSRYDFLPKKISEQEATITRALQEKSVYSIDFENDGINEIYLFENGSALIRKENKRKYQRTNLLEILKEVHKEIGKNNSKINNLKNTLK